MGSLNSLLSGIVKLLLEESTANNQYIGEELNLDDVNLESVFRLIKKENQPKIISSFQEANKQFYKQGMTAQRFLGVYAHNNKQFNINHPDLKFLHFNYVLGIPVMVLTSEIWSKIYSSDRCAGVHSEKGIIVIEHPQAKAFLSHEITHSLVRYFKQTGYFKSSQCAVLDLIRNEAICYLLNNPKQLNSHTFDNACHALSRKYESKLTTKHPNYLQLILLIQKLDQDGMNVNRTQVARTFLMFSTVETINAEIIRLAKLNSKR